MKEVVRFFWEREKRAVQMDMGNPTGKYLRESVEWTDAYKNTLSNSQKKKFDTEWNKLEKELESFNSATPKQQNNMNPMQI